jgi:hypothetical protein
VSTWHVRTYLSAEEPKESNLHAVVSQKVCDFYARVASKQVACAVDRHHDVADTKRRLHPRNHLHERVHRGCVQRVVERVKRHESAAGLQQQE